MPSPTIGAKTVANRGVWGEGFLVICTHLETRVKGIHWCHYRRNPGRAVWILLGYPRFIPSFTHILPYNYMTKWNHYWITYQTHFGILRLGTQYPLLKSEETAQGRKSPQTILTVFPCDGLIFGITEFGVEIRGWFVTILKNGGKNVWRKVHFWN